MNSWARILALVAILTLGRGAAVADDPPPPFANTACHCDLPLGKKVTLHGVLILQNGTLLLKGDDGTQITLQDSPEVIQLKQSQTVKLDGTPAEVSGLLSGVVIRAQKLALLNGPTPKVVISTAFPIRGRCVHCGCRMTVNSAGDMDSVCTMCKCGQKCSECMK